MSTYSQPVHTIAHTQKSSQNHNESDIYYPKYNNEQNEHNTNDLPIRNKLPLNLFHSAAEYNKMLISNGKNRRKKNSNIIDGVITSLQYVNDHIFQKQNQKKLKARTNQIISVKSTKKQNQNCICCCCQDYCNICVIKTNKCQQNKSKINQLDINKIKKSIDQQISLARTGKLKQVNNNHNHSQYNRTISHIGHNNYNSNNYHSNNYHSNNNSNHNINNNNKNKNSNNYHSNNNSNNNINHNININNKNNNNDNNNDNNNKQNGRNSSSYYYKVKHNNRSSKRGNSSISLSQKSKKEQHKNQPTLQRKINQKDISHLIMKSVIDFNEQRKAQQLQKINNHNIKIAKQQYLQQLNNQIREQNLQFARLSCSKKSQKSISKHQTAILYWQKIRNQVVDSIKNDNYSKPLKKQLNKYSFNVYDHKQLNKRKIQLNQQQRQFLRKKHQQQAIVQIQKQIHNKLQKTNKIKMNLKHLQKQRKKRLGSCQKKSFKPTADMIQNAFKNIIQSDIINNHKNTEIFKNSKIKNNKNKV